MSVILLNKIIYSKTILAASAISWKAGNWKASWNIKCVYYYCIVLAMQTKFEACRLAVYIICGFDIQSIWTQKIVFSMYLIIVQIIVINFSSPL
jgi:hypothetical protein